MKTLSVEMCQATNKKGGLTPERTRIIYPPSLPFLSCLTESTESDILRVNQAQRMLLKYIILPHQRIVPSPSIIEVPPLT